MFDIDVIRENFCGKVQFFALARLCKRFCQLLQSFVRKCIFRTNIYCTCMNKKVTQKELQLYLCSLGFRLLPKVMKNLVMAWERGYSVH